MSPFDFAIVLASALLHALWSVAIKSSGNPLAFNWLQIVIGVSGLVLAAPWIPWAAVPGSVWATMAATGVAHAAYMFWMGRAYETGDLSLVYPIARSTPAFLPLLAVPLLGEQVRPGGALGIAVVVLGIWWVHLGPDTRGTALHSSAARFAYLTLGATVVYSLLDKSAMATLGALPREGPLPWAITYSVLYHAFDAFFLTPMVVARLGWQRLRQEIRPQLRTACFAAAISFVGYALIPLRVPDGVGELRGRSATDECDLRRDPRGRLASGASGSRPARGRCGDRRRRRPDRALRLIAR